MNITVTGKGFFFAILAYIMWGAFPLYWKLLAQISSVHIVASRILFSLILVAIILLMQKKYTWLAVFKEPKKAILVILTALLLCSNWCLYIWSVNTGRTIEASLGYYINPLVSIVLGLFFFRERLKPLQWAAVFIAFTGVMILTILSGTLPWVSLVLAFTFGFYVLIKKILKMPALESLGSETLASAPIGILLLCFTFGGGANGSPPVFTGLPGLAYITELPVHTLILLSFSGALTMLPLYFFACGAKILPLSALGFTQFIAPTIQFLLGIFVFGEVFHLRYFISFLFIWAAVALYIVSLRRK